MSDVHRYTMTCSWEGTTAGGYDAYDRAHRVAAPSTDAALPMSSDPAFRGDPSLLNPEQLLVAAAASCQLLSFLAVVARARVDVVAYADESVGEMPDGEHPMQLTRITLRPRVTVRGDVTDDRLAHLTEVAHRHCFIANSLKTEVVVEPTFVRMS